jgi:hypothetical protein
MTITISSGPKPTTGVYDSFECAIDALAPRCAHCGCTIVGHGVEADGTRFCCAHCAREMGATGLVDRAGSGTDAGSDVANQAGSRDEDVDLSAITSVRG